MILENSEGVMAKKISLHNFDTYTRLLTGLGGKLIWLAQGEMCGKKGMESSRVKLLWWSNFR